MPVKLHSLVILLLGIGEERRLDILTGRDSQNRLRTDPLMDVQSNRIDLESALFALDRSPKPRLVFRPEKLRDLGVPVELIEAATNSEPQGFILFEDLLEQIPSRSNGSADQPNKRR